MIEERKTIVTIDRTRNKSIDEPFLLQRTAFSCPSIAPETNLIMISTISFCPDQGTF